ncbi:MAG: hypothetical protein P8Y12_00805 [Gammaproteobacteria bacterium]|jgi:hypothetical protein
MLLAVGNGILREATYGQILSELQAHQLSTLTGILAMTAAVWPLSLWKQPDSAQQALLIGIIWLFATVSFEFVFGHYVAGHSWPRLFQDYNLLSGRVWLLFLIWLVALPYAVFKLHALSS